MANSDKAPVSLASAVVSGSSNKLIGALIVAMLGGGGVSLKQMADLPTKDEIRSLVKEASIDVAKQAAEDAANKVLNRALERLSSSESRIDSRIDELYRRIDRMAPYAAAAAPLIRGDRDARDTFKRAKRSIRHDRDPFPQDPKP